MRKEKELLRKVTTLSSSLPDSALGRRQNNLHFWEQSKVPYNTKLKLWLISEYRNKIYILLYVQSAPWNQKMGKCSYTMPRKICLSTNQSLPGISLYPWKCLNQLSKTEKVSIQLLNEAVIDQGTEIIRAPHNTSSWFLLQHFHLLIYTGKKFAFLNLFFFIGSASWSEHSDINWSLSHIHF